RIYRRVRLGNLLSEEPPLPMVIIKNLRKQQKSLIRMAGYGLVTSAELMRMATSRSEERRVGEEWGRSGGRAREGRRLRREGEGSFFFVKQKTAYEIET